MAPPSNKKRAWCFTYFPEYIDHTDDEFLGVIHGLETLGTRYLVAGKETCPDTDRLHLQGYVYFENARSLRRIKRAGGRRINLRPARGNSKQNRDYCTKEDDFYESGKLPGQGNRTDLRAAIEIAKAGGTLHDYLASERPTWQGLKNFEKLATTVATKNLAGKRTQNKQVHWFYGPPGSGKTYHARTTYPDAWVSTSLGNNRWFTGYTAQRVAYFDEVHPDQYRKTVELNHRLLHEWHETVEVKGGFVVWLPEIIIISSLFSPVDFAKQVYIDDNACKQLYRRLSTVTRFERNGNAYTRHQEPVPDH